MRVSLITTVLNEEKTIDVFLDSVAAQTKKPDEVIVVDGGSVDWTIDKLQRRGVSDINLKIMSEPGANRSQGRNAGVKIATGEIVAITDAGCVLDKDWLSEITKPFSDPKVEVVAGYYRGMAKTIFEKCVIPFVLVMPNEVDPNNFYPASRSMAIRKGTFWQVGGFPEEFSDNEDYVFANVLAKNNIKSFFAKGAIINWLPRSNLKSFWTMIYRFARGDSKAGLRRKKVATVFGRYLIFMILLGILITNWITQLLFSYLAIWFIYLLWAIGKNFQYIKDVRAIFLLPILQVTADLAVMAGTFAGLSQKNPPTLKLQKG